MLKNNLLLKRLSHYYIITIYRSKDLTSILWLEAIQWHIFIEQFSSLNFYEYEYLIFTAMLTSTASSSVAPFSRGEH